MYVAACCCGGDPGPVCDCADAESLQGEITFIFGRRTATHIYRERCDACGPDATLADQYSRSTTVNDYLEVKVPVSCAGGPDGTLYTGDVSDERKAVMTALHGDRDISARYTECHDPEYFGAPCDTWTRTQFSNVDDPVVLNEIEFGTTEFPDGVLDASASASTRLRRGDDFANLYPWMDQFLQDTIGEGIEPDKYYRWTQASAKYQAERYRTNTFVVFENGVEDPSQGYDFSGNVSTEIDPFGWQTLVTICKLDECDATEFGATLVTFVQSQFGREVVPFESFTETVVTPPSDCPSVPAYGQCPEVPSRPNAGETRIDTANLVGSITGFRLVAG